MEVSFPDVSRIADIAWEPQKIVFEVQCAAITPEEVLARNADYGSIGYRVIWILHTDRYGKGMLSPAEQVLRGSTHYYTDIDAKGEGSVFDIVDLVVGRYRKQRLSIGPVQLERPLMDRELEAAPCQWITRRAANGVFFRGDALWSGFVGGDRKVERALYRFWRREQWARWQVLQRCGQLLDTLIFHPYRCLFRLALERASR